jgi:hypothetical protein
MWDEANQIVSFDSRLTLWALALQLHRVLYGVRRVNWDEVA